MEQDLKIHRLPLTRIIIDSQIDVTDAYFQRMRKTKNQIYDLLLAVEEHPYVADHYLLVGGIDRYYYLRETNQEYAPCLIEASSHNVVFRELKKLTRLFNKGDTNISNKRFILARLKWLNVPMEFIANLTPLSITELKTKFRFNPDIPKHLITKDSNEKTLNWIDSLPLGQTVKEFMFKRAGLPKRNSQRLCQDSIKIINKLLNEPLFWTMKPNHQIIVISTAIGHKTITLSVLREMMRDFCRTF